jgi:hypothetical protein
MTPDDPTPVDPAWLSMQRVIMGAADADWAQNARWWHVYGAEVRNAQWGGLDEDGRPNPVWLYQTYGESTKPPSQVPDDISSGDDVLLRLGSFDHEPTDAELDALTPERYRDEDVQPPARVLNEFRARFGDLGGGTA